MLAAFDVLCKRDRVGQGANDRVSGAVAETVKGGERKGRDEMGQVTGGLRQETEGGCRGQHAPEMFVLELGWGLWKIQGF